MIIRASSEGVNSPNRVSGTRRASVSRRPDIEAGKHDPGRICFWRGMTVLGRLGQPSAIASVAAFLASDQASCLIGQNIAVDGGWTIGYPPSIRTREDNSNTDKAMTEGSHAMWVERARREIPTIANT